MHKLGVEFLVVWDILHYMQKYIDAHCHYITSMPDGTVSGFVYNSARPCDWSVAIDAARVRGGAGAIGVHPWYVDELSGALPDQMAQLLRANPELMVGEIGLDASRGDIDAQMPVFIRQLDLACEFGRAAHIHCVRAWDKILHIFATHKMPPVVVLHGFRGTPEIVSAIMRHANAYFSFGANPGAVVRAVEPDRILVESDAASVSVARGILPRTVAQIADLVGCPAQTMAETIYNNTQRMIKNG